ncbi:MAG TPA: hypothetical protein GX514_07005 [Thermoanaerobacterales bacterium]|nr:hypothetical protein [Thermoanaerobacterales bacterium]
MTKDDFNRIEGNIQELENTKETPAGAQEKADAAETNAKAYADTAVGVVEDELESHKDDYATQLAGCIFYALPYFY